MSASASAEVRDAWPEPACFICLEPTGYLFQLCNCSVVMHFECQQQMVRRMATPAQSLKCAVCLTQYRNIDIVRTRPALTSDGRRLLLIAFGNFASFSLGVYELVLHFTNDGCSKPVGGAESGTPRCLIVAVVMFAITCGVIPPLRSVFRESTLVVRREVLHVRNPRASPRGPRSAIVPWMAVVESSEALTVSASN